MSGDVRGPTKMADLSALLAPHREALLQATARVLESGRFIMGPHLLRFEAEFAERVGVGHAIGVSSGTDALILALSALDIGPGDRVLTTPYSFISSTSAVVACGATPVFADIDPGTFNLSAAAVEAWIRQDPRGGRDVKAILPVHLFGQCADLDALTQIADDLGASVIEDAAQAIDASLPGPNSLSRRAGSGGKLGCFSFFPTKNLGAVGDAGIVVTDDPALAERLRRARSHGASAAHHHLAPGGNHRLDELQAAFLCVLLPHLEGWTARRRDHARGYDAALAGTSIAPPPRPFGLEAHACHQYVVRLPDRDRVRARLAAEGIETAVYYPTPIHLQPTLRFLEYDPGDFPEAERAAAETLALPIHPTLPVEAPARVAAAVAKAAAAVSV